MDALSIAHVPGASSIIFRRTLPELEMAGGLIPLSHEWLQGKAEYNSQKHRWTFANGFTLSFGYLEHENDRYRYQGGAWQRMGFDELTHFHEHVYEYLHSRCRRALNVDAIPHVRSTTNPGGRGHKWVKARFVEPGRPDRPFIPSRIEDNPYLDGDGYRLALSNLDHTTRRQLEHGEWIDDAGARVFPLTERNLIDAPPEWGDGGWRYTLAVDFGSSQASPTTAYQVVGWHKEAPHATWALETQKASGSDPSDVAKRIKSLSGRYGGFDAIVVDEGALGKSLASELRRVYAIPCQPADKKSKAAFRRMLIGAIERGDLKVVAPACAGLVDEMRDLVWGADGNDVQEGLADHACDALLYAWRETRSHAARAPASQPVEPSQEEAFRSQLEAERKKYLARKGAPFWRNL